MKREDLVGTWKLVSHLHIAPDGASEPLGADLKGRLLYGSDGAMSVLITIGADPAADRGAADLIAYAGKYSVSEGKVFHHVEVAAGEKRVGRTEERLANLSGRRLTLRTPMAADGHFEIVWEKSQA